MHLPIVVLSWCLLHYALALCPPTGPVLPPPSISQSFNLSNLTKLLDSVSANATASGWNSSTTSFSIDITSVNSSFFTYHYTAPLRNTSGTQEVDGDTAFRVGSVTKVFTVLAVLMETSMSLEDPIGKYVGELKGSKWGDVTLGLLASQLAGVQRDGDSL
jgi:CubicO group peptidase (beta-lactamase class C family)